MTTVSTSSWQQQLNNSFKNIEQLCEFLELTPTQISTLAVSAEAAQQFVFKVPYSFAARMEKGNPNDPLLKQVLPSVAETVNRSGFSADPVGDLAAATVGGVLHKYYGRALFISTGSCAINCRYCFRRNFPYSEHQISQQRQQQAIQYIQQHTEISELILSGGDPLLLADHKLAILLQQADEISHLKRIRIHTRIPIVLPARVTPELLSVLIACSKQIVIVVHSNHAQELNHEVANAAQAIRRANITLLNQAVLLKGINDNTEQLCHLSERLFELGILPYYLHLLDKATGTAHFEVTQTEALALMHQLQAKLPGYLVPKLVREQAAHASKTLVF